MNRWAGLGLATWHGRGNAPGEMSDVFVVYDHGEGDSHPDGEGGMPRAAWGFIEGKVREHRLDYCLVRLINCDGRPTDLPYLPDPTDLPVVVQGVGAGVPFNAAPPTVRPGDRIRYHGEDGQLEGVVTGFATHLGDEVVLLAGGTWCYRHDLI